MADDRDQGEEIHASYNDERDYVCRTWQLEPKLRFLYWNSALEAPGIDAILQRVSCWSPCKNQIWAIFYRFRDMAAQKYLTTCSARIYTCACDHSQVVPTRYARQAWFNTCQPRQANHSTSLQKQKRKRLKPYSTINCAFLLIYIEFTHHIPYWVVLLAYGKFHDHFNQLQ